MPSLALLADSLHRVGDVVSRPPAKTLFSHHLIAEANDIALWRCRIEDAIATLSPPGEKQPHDVSESVVFLRAMLRRSLAAETSIATEIAIAQFDEREGLRNAEQDWGRP